MMRSLQGDKFKGTEEDMNAVTLFCPNDFIRLSGIIGSKRAKEMIQNLNKKDKFTVCIS
jgi:hypothetical protein